MLNNVPKHVSFATRQVVLRHPNSMECLLFEKRVTREEIIDGQPSTMGGEPTSGGMGELNSEDEAEFEYAQLGEGRILFVGPFPGAAVNERDDGLTPQSFVEAQIVCLADPGSEEFFDPDKNHVVIVMPSDDLAVQYEIVDVLGNINIPPYTRRYLLNPRDVIVQMEEAEEDEP